MGQYKPLQVAIVGCGNISRAFGASLSKRPDQVEVIGAYDLDQDKATSYVSEFGGQIYPSLEALLDDEKVEAVVNLTIHTAHAEVTAAALNAGKHVHVEKPLATNREDGQMVVDLAEAKGLRLSASPFTFLGEGQQRYLLRADRLVLPITLSPKVSSPDRIRTGVSGLKTQRPRPLDDGAV